MPRARGFVMAMRCPPTTTPGRVVPPRRPLGAGVGDVLGTA